MKKLFKAFYVIAILLISLGATMQSCSSSDPATLAKEYAEEANKKCPYDLGDGIVIENTKAEGSTVTIKMEAEDVDVSQINKEWFVASAKEDKEVTDLINKGITMKITVCNGDQCKGFTITKDDLK